MTASKVQLVAHQRPQMMLSRNPSTTTTTTTTSDFRPARIVTKRCLFGPPDPQELQDVVNRCMDRERQRAIENYGFDVKTEKIVNNTNISVIYAAAGMLLPTTNSESKTTTEEKCAGDCLLMNKDEVQEVSVESTKSSNSLKLSANVIATKTLSPKKPYERLRKPQMLITG